MKMKKIFAIFGLSSLLIAGSLFAIESAKGQKNIQAKATTDVGEISVSEVRNAISTDSAMYLLPTQNYDLPDSWDYAYTAVGEEDGIFINGVKYAGSLKYAGTGSAFITFYFGLPAAAVEGDVVEFKGAFACAAADRSFTMNFAAQRFASTWIRALEAYDTVSLKDANLPDISGTAINTDDMGLNTAYTADAAGLPKRNGYFGLTNDTGSYAFQINYKKTATGTGWFHVLIGGQGPLWRTGHFIDFGFLDAWADTGHTQIKEMQGKDNNWEADEIQATGAIALGWEVGQTNLLEMGKIKVKGSSQYFIFFKVNGALKFGEYWTLAEGGMTTKVTLQYAGTDATVTNTIEPASTKLSPATYVPAAKQLYMNMENDICPAVSNNWDDYFKSVDSNGLKLNGENVGVDNWNFFKKTGSKQMFLALGDIGITPASGDILYVGGMFKAAKEVNGVKVLFKANFADSYFQFDGENWLAVDPDYMAVDFAKDLLKATLTICTGEGGNNHDALVDVWATLASANYYGKLVLAEKAILTSTSADSTVVVPATASSVDAMDDDEALGAAMYRYEYCTAKYTLNQFISGRTISPSNIGINALRTNNNNEIVVVLLSILTVSLCGLCIVYFYSRKRKEEK